MGKLVIKLHSSKLDKYSINVRIQIENTKMKLNEDLSSTIRRLKLIFSSYAPSDISQFIIDKTGIQDVIDV